MISNSEFVPAAGLKNCHLQTLLPTLLRSRLKVDYINQALELPDGDFIDLSWTEKPVNDKPIVIVFHGLEGSGNSPYSKGIMREIKKQGWTGLVMHFRGCSGKLNRLARSYHSGETGDAMTLISWLTSEYPGSPLMAIGYSLGGNMLVKLQGELGDKSPLVAAVSVCAPLELNECAIRINQGFSRFYQSHLINRLKAKVIHKRTRIDLNLPNEFNIKKIKTFRQFDNHITAPLHGFNGVDDYYMKASSKQYIKHIKKPTLIIQALDDPFMSNKVIPVENELSEFTRLEISQYGGHVGFVSGSVLKPIFWLEERIIKYLSRYR